MKIRNSEEHNKGPFKRPFEGRFLFTMSTEGYLVEFHKVNYFVETPASLLVHFFFQQDLVILQALFFFAYDGFSTYPKVSPASPS